MSKLPNQKIIGITGTIGSGKSTVAQLIQAYAPIIDCDQINADLLKKGEAGYNEIIKLPWIVLDPHGNIDKVRMARAIFTDPDKKKKIESILHPLIFEKLDSWIEKRKEPLLFVEMPLLFESGSQDRFDSIWCVSVSRSVALERLVRYRHFDPDDASRRIQNQWSVDEKMKRSDHVLLNDGFIADLKKQVELLLRKEEERV